MDRFTIKDVAALAGLSPSTVSRVLSGTHKVSEDKQTKVLEAVNKLNYSPNVFARGLKNKRTETIGLLIPDIVDPFFSQLARGVEDRAHQFRYNVILCNSDNDPEREKKNLQVLMEKQVDGIIFTTAGKMDNIANIIHNQEVPLVLMDRNVDGILDLDTVTVDDSGGAEQVMDYLIKLGHRKIGLLMGPSFLSTSRGRLEGYRAGLIRNGVGYDPDLVVGGDFTLESGYKLTKQLLESQRDFTAVFAMNDLMALGAIEALEEVNLNVPHDISVVGFGDIYLTKLVKPRLTTVTLPIYDIGSESFNLLLDCINFSENHQKQRVVLKTSLVIRESCSECKKSDCQKK